ncbi:CD109 antigen isoform X1 [Varanus komodoensis]|uniref:CD109 antigen isoform X1 n=1 Tax=Varanus komodoensis TaxID=61221 RepID=UPI001CF78837|nr:CD109 antigen isoform X1 [Varanus komodoensis]
MEYVLSKFEVFLTTPLHYSPKDTSFNGTVTAKYTYGKPVKGKVTLAFFPLYYGKKRTITKTLEINGSVNFALDSLEMKNITYIDWEEYMPVEITAVVTESLTGISQNSSTTVFPKLHDYLLEFSEYSRVLKPSLDFFATLKVTRHDNRPLTSDERRNEVMITVKASGRGSYSKRYGNEFQRNASIQQRSYPVPANGLVQIEFPVLENTTTLYIEAEYMEIETSVTVYEISYSASMTYVLIKKTPQNLKVGTPLELNVQSNRPVKEISYMVMSKEQIVAVGKKKSTTFTLTPEHSWVPTASIIAFYVSDNGEVISDALSVPVQPVFKNQVNMYWNKNKAGPSEEVTLKINVTEPNTTIALLVVDKSTNILGKRSDITEDTVLHELSLYNKEIFYGEPLNSHSVFQKCNLWVSTDASFPEIEEYDDPYPGITAFSGQAYDTSHPLMNTAMKEVLSSPHVRTNFPETWIWREITIGATQATVNVTVPDTITSWVASAFIISENLGLGVMEVPLELEVFQPFFVSLNLPPSVTRGEAFILEVSIFNYLKESTEATVTLDTSDTFEILIISNDINAMGNQRSVWIPSDHGKTVIFPIKPKQIGEIPIRVTAISPIASDALLQKVTVKAEGVEQFHSQALILDLPKLVETLNFTFPSDVVPGSERVQVTVIGDILGPSINGIESLIKMPYGCGEQNMINFAPNIYVLDYLTKRDNLKSSLKSKAVSYMREGYQRELLYQRDDGSFSAFGNSDNSGSTWLSAFVLRSFIQAQPFIDIDPYILEATASWIVSHQKTSGEFEEPGRLLHTELQGGTNTPVSLTAYITAALLEYQTDKYAENIRRALNFLEFKLSEGIPDNYTLALVTYALSLSRSAESKTALDTLNKRSEQGELRFWISPSSELSDSWQPRSIDIETAGYALLAHAKQERLLEGFPIMKWLSQQRNHLGGFSSTQDTIVALHALSASAIHTPDMKPEMDVTVDASSEPNPAVFRINPENCFVLQTKEIAATQPVEVTVSASGRGLGLFQLNIMYNVKNSHTSRRRRSAQNPEAFDLDVVVKDNEKDINHLTVNVCTRYLGAGTSSRSGMALLEVGLLSGFSLSPNFMSLGDPVKKVEEDDGKVHIYFDSLNETQVCVDIPAVRDFKVANTQAAFVTVLDYYEPRRRTVRSYNSKVMNSLSSCTFCEKNECDLCGTGGSPLISLSWELLVVHISLLYSWLIQ